MELRSFGGPEGLVVAARPDPEPGPFELRVDLVAAALNRRDWWIRNGGKVQLPAVLGSDGAGVVSALGAGVLGVNVGDEVVIYPGRGWGEREEAAATGFELLGVPRQGTYAERVVVDAEQVRPRPPGWSWAESAALPVAGLTAWRALVRYAHAGPGKTILVPGGGGGVATFAIQIGHALGARMVTTTSTPKKLDRLRGLGAAAGADYRSSDWPDRLGPVDAVIDSVGGAAWPGALRALRPGGVLVCFGDTDGEVGSIAIAELFFRYLRVQGTTVASPREFDALLAHCAQSSWRPAIDSIFPLEDVVEAHHRMDAPDRFGKIVLAIDDARFYAP
ncbi:MAG: zinc-binding dehydrogenase [Actinomycetota bacterium]|nr:zinc-binding dehydrogenase [Actinomycetota bacterium]